MNKKNISIISIVILINPLIPFYFSFPIFLVCVTYLLRNNHFRLIYIFVFFPICMLYKDLKKDLFGYISAFRAELQNTPFSAKERDFALEELFLVNLRIELEGSPKQYTAIQRSVLLSYMHRLQDSPSPIAKQIFKDDAYEYRHYLQKRLRVTDTEEAQLEMRLVNYFFSVPETNRGLEDIFFGYFHGDEGASLFHYSLDDDLVRQSALQDLKTTIVLLSKDHLDSTFKAVIAPWLQRTLLNGGLDESARLLQLHELEKYQTYLTVHLQPSLKELDFLL